MSRASRMLKWPVAATVLLAAAPIAYAEPSTANTANTPPSAPADSARCDGRIRDFTGSHTVAGPADVMCTDPAAAARVTSFTATGADGSGTVTLVRR